MHLEGQERRDVLRDALGSARRLGSSWHNQQALENLAPRLAELPSADLYLHFPRKPIGEQAPADEISPPHLRGRELPQPWSVQ